MSANLGQITAQGLKSLKNNNLLCKDIGLYFVLWV